MPLSFATLLGGMCSLTGTPANLVVNEWMAGETGRDLGYFELAIVGGPLTVVGIVWLVFGAPRIFARFAMTDGPAGDAGPSEFVAERILAQSSQYVGMHLAEFERAAGVRLHGVVRHGAHVFARRRDLVLAANDTWLISRCRSVPVTRQLSAKSTFGKAGNSSRGSPFSL